MFALSPRAASVVGLVALSVLMAPPASAQFQEVASLGDFTCSSVGWGDYNGDGDLDLAIMGWGIDYGALTRVFPNTGTFQSFNYIGLPGWGIGTVAWGDHDRDGYLDLFLAGGNELRLHDGPSLVPAALLPGGDAVAWGDYDNDGDLDAVVAGHDGTVRALKLLRNTNGQFTVSATLDQLGGRSACAWADFDNDGDLDLAVSGESQLDPGYVSELTIYRNEGGSDPVFTDIDAGLVGVLSGSLDWGDYDNDGDLDLLATGWGDPTPLTVLYRNGGGSNPTFTPATPFLSVAAGAARWGDYDNDGLLDVAQVGRSQSGTGSAKVYRNLGGSSPTFYDTFAPLPAVEGADVAWGDWDNDGDLDIVLGGSSQIGRIARVYANSAATSPNAPPSAPSGLAAVPMLVDGQPALTFSWDPSTDDVTPQQSLSYNLRVGTTPGGSEIASAMANAATGRRMVPALGNTGLRTSWTLRVPAAGTYCWSVQAIDGGFAGSPFAPEQMVDVTVSAESPAPPTAFALRPVAPNPFRRSASIGFDLPRAAAVRLEVFDVAGRAMRTLADQSFEAGRHAATWDGRGIDGRVAPNGVYLVRMKTDAFEATRTLVLMH